MTDPAILLMLRPNKPVRSHCAPAGEGWIAQPKFDGKRALVLLVPGGEPVIHNRHGRKLAVSAETEKDLSHFSRGLCYHYLLDGEWTKKGKLWVWDIVDGMSGELSPGSPYLARYLFLLSMSGPFNITPIVHGSYAQLKAKLSKDPDVEGVVYKREDARDLWGPWSTGETGSQIKVKWR